MRYELARLASERSALPLHGDEDALRTPFVVIFAHQFQEPTSCSPTRLRCRLSLCTTAGQLDAPHSLVRGATRMIAWPSRCNIWNARLWASPATQQFKSGFVPAPSTRNLAHNAPR